VVAVVGIGESRLVADWRMVCCCESPTRRRRRFKLGWHQQVLCLSVRAEMEQVWAWVLGSDRQPWKAQFWEPDQAEKQMYRSEETNVPKKNLKKINWCPRKKRKLTKRISTQETPWWFSYNKTMHPQNALYTNHKTEPIIRGTEYNGSTTCSIAVAFQWTTLYCDT
jgi:hypothetical protein